MEGDRLRLTVVSARRFVLVFGILFVPTFVAIAWLAIPDLPTRLFFTIFGAIVGVGIHAFIYGLLAYHESLGDYLVVDLDQQTLELPRAKVTFPLDQVFGFQLISGRSKASADIETDLNLLVAGNETLLRYHILGSPMRKMVEQLASCTGLRLDEINLGSGGFRDADRSGG